MKNVMRFNTLLALGAAGLAAASFAPCPTAQAAEKLPQTTATSKAATKKVPAPSRITVAKSGYSTSLEPCTANERWRFGPNVFSEWRDEMNELLSGGSKPVWGFVQALGLRRQAQSNEAKVFAEYWISRSLLNAKLKHIAWSGLNVVAAREPTPETVGVQLAALGCLAEIHRRYPTFELSSKVSAQIKTYAALAPNERQKSIVWEYAGHILRDQLARGDDRASLQATLEVLRGSSAHESLAKGLIAAKAGNHSQTIAQMEKFVTHPNIPSSLRVYEDTAHLLMSRAYYSTQQFDRAAERLKYVKKSSNELAHALSELTWAYLLQEKQSEAIGTAINLQQGGLRHTFTPEAPMVMAMALNEICQYPESLRAVDTFRRYYEKPYKWLSHYLGSDAATRPELYSLAIQYLKNDPRMRRRTLAETQSATHIVPSKVGSEWTRSPLFISHQDEINLLIETRDSKRILSKSGASEQRRLAATIKAHSASIKQKIRTAKKSMKPGEDLPMSVRQELSKLRTELIHYQRFRSGAPVWRVVLANFEKKAGPTQIQLVKSINHDLLARSHRMLYQIEEVVENNQLIEVEIYNGASQDIIWQNAHPDYKNLAQDMRQDHDKRAAAKVWDWGKVAAADTEDGGEIWEDELGSFKADLFDNCDSKDKYLKLKRLSYAK